MKKLDAFVMTSADIFFGVNVAFLIGIIGASFALPFVLLVLLSLMFISISVLYSKKYAFFIFLVPIIGGFFYYYGFINVTIAEQNIDFNVTREVKGIVVAEPKNSSQVKNIILQLEAPFKGTVRVLTSSGQVIKYGDVLILRGIIVRGERGIAESFFPQIRIGDHHRGFWLKEKMIGLKNNFTGALNRSLPTNEAALLAGITFGARADFDKDLKSQMAMSGTTHLIALSGYNIAILVVVLRKSLGKFLKRKASFFTTIGVILLFVLMVGAEASVVRAAIMGFLLLIAKEKGRLYNIKNAIAFTAVCMTLLDPSIIRYDIGFELSFASLLGLVYIEPFLREKVFTKFVSHESLLDWRENFITTLAAQIAVMPLLLIIFNQASLLGIFANTLILPFVPLTMFFGFLLSGIGLISPNIGYLLAQCVYLLLHYELAVIKIFARNILIPPISPIIFAIAYYLIIGTIVMRYYEQQRKIF